MATKEGFRLIRTDHAEDPEQLDVWRDHHRTSILSRILKTSILGVAVAAIVCAVLLVRDPQVLFTNAAALLDTRLAPQDGTDKSTPMVQSAVGTQALLPTSSEPLPGGATSAASRTTDPVQTEIGQPPAAALLGQFQAWAADETTRAEARYVQPAHDAQVPRVQDDKPQIQPVQKHGQVRRVQNARAEIRAAQNLRAKVRSKQNARVQVRPTDDARAQERPALQPLSFLQSIGLRE